MSSSSVSFSNITFENLKEVAFRGAKQAYENEAPALSEANIKLGAFQSEVDQRASELQNSRVSIPSEEALLQEAVTFVTTYEQLYASALKAKVLSEELRNVIEFLTPKPRAYADQTMLEGHAVELNAEIGKTNEACVQHIKELGDLWGKVETLQTKMMLQILGNTAWSVQRFCQIVDNKGKPIAWYTRAIDNCTTPVVPKKADLEARLEALKNKIETAPSSEKKDGADQVASSTT
ncbi:MAG: hypothetical protein JSR39_08320 [Verrucomicrobia bacterium]|nr:hypothetical protein [Verrucomicrobiota bacterium]